MAILMILLISLIFSGCSQTAGTIYPTLQTCKDTEPLHIRPFKKGNKICMTEKEYNKLKYRDIYKTRCIEMLNAQNTDFNKKFTKVEDDKSRQNK